jgi:hypothetical protein
MEEQQREAESLRRRRTLEILDSILRRFVQSHAALPTDARNMERWLEDESSTNTVEHESPQ